MRVKFLAQGNNGSLFWGLVQEGSICFCVLSTLRHVFQSLLQAHTMYLQLKHAVRLQMCYFDFH